LSAEFEELKDEHKNLEKLMEKYCNIGRSLETQVSQHQV